MMAAKPFASIYHVERTKDPQVFNIGTAHLDAGCGDSKLRNLLSPALKEITTREDDNSGPDSNASESSAHLVAVQSDSLTQCLSLVTRCFRDAAANEPWFGYTRMQTPDYLTRSLPCRS